MPKQNQSQHNQNQQNQTDRSIARRNQLKSFQIWAAKSQDSYRVSRKKFLSELKKELEKNGQI